MRAYRSFLSFMLLPILFLLPVATLAGGADDAGPVLTVRETGVALYPRQDPESDRIATLEKGETLIPMLEAVGNEPWYLVRTRQGINGWVRAEDVIRNSKTTEAFKGKEVGASTWSARDADGRTFNGTWDVSPSSNRRSATGGWTLSDAKGATVMRGSWSADKHETGWNGVWRATVEGGQAEQSGSWSAEFPHMRNATFSDLFAAAAKEAMRGLWTGGSASGSWTIHYAN
jgi:hypothetical protein